MIALDFTARAGAFTLTAQAQARTPGVIGVFGPSGAGKTTLLRAIAGLAPIEGEITLDGAALTGPPEMRRIAFVFQDSRLFPHLSVRDNVLYGLKRAPTPHALALDAVSAALGIDALIDRAPRTLSGGEQKRVALARALLSQPRLILMDEPLAGVDDARKGEILNLIVSVRRRFDAAILLVSHNLDEIAALADDVLLVEAGRITDAGPAGDVFASLDSPLAERSDARALIDGVLRSSDPAQGVSTVAAGEAALTLPWISDAPGARVRLQIFARDVTLATKAPEAISTQNVLPARILGVRTRADRLALLRLQTPAGALLASITQQAARRLALAPGGDVFALVKASAFAPRG